MKLLFSGLSTDCDTVTCWGWSSVEINYYITNLGGNQLPIKSASFKFEESTQHNTKTVADTYYYWLLPGEKSSKSTSISKNIWSSSVAVWMSINSIDSSNTLDLKGNSINGLALRNRWFPQASYSRLTYGLNGYSIYTMTVVIDNINDNYARYFNIHRNGDFSSPWLTCVISTSGFSGGFILPSGTTSITLEIHWGGKSANGWELEQLQLNPSLY